MKISMAFSVVIVMATMNTDHCSHNIMIDIYNVWYQQRIYEWGEARICGALQQFSCYQLNKEGSVVLWLQSTQT